MYIRTPVETTWVNKVTLEFYQLNFYVVAQKCIERFSSLRGYIGLTELICMARKVIKPGGHVLLASSHTYVITYIQCKHAYQKFMNTA